MTEEPVFFDDKTASEEVTAPKIEEPKKTEVSVQKPNLIIPGLFLFLIVSIVLGTGYMMIRNRLYKKQLDTEINRPKFSDLVPSQKPTISSDSGTQNMPVVAPSYAPTLVDGGTIGGTKGGLAVAPTPIVTPTPTPTPTPAPKPAVKGTTTTKTTTTNSVLNKVYFDAQYPYRISFIDTWNFARTYGAGTGNSEDQILSAVEFTRSNSRVSLNLLRGRGISDIREWIKNTPYSEAPTIGGDDINYAGNKAVRFTYRLSDDREVQKIYFIRGAIIYRLSATYENSLSSEAKAILNSFIPDRG